MASPSDENAYWNGGFNDALGIPLVWRDGPRMGCWNVPFCQSLPQCARPEDKMELRMRCRSWYGVATSLGARRHVSYLWTQFFSFCPHRLRDAAHGHGLL